jgi:hypothetical protein
LRVKKILILGRQQKLPEIFFPAGKTEDFMLKRPVISLSAHLQGAFAFGTLATEPDPKGIRIVLISCHGLILPG